VDRDEAREAPAGRHIRPPRPRHSARPVASTPSKNARDSRSFQLTSSVVAVQRHAPAGTSRPIASSGSIAEDSRVRPSASASSEPTLVSRAPRRRAPRRRPAACAAAARGRPAPRRACHSHSVAAGRAASWRKNAPAAGEWRASTRAVA
jgi:hypothetical protein